MQGTVVAITGARKGPELARAFDRRGAITIQAPLVSGDLPASDDEIVRDTRLILDRRPEWMVASTGVGVRLWLDACERAGLRDHLAAYLSEVRCLARGAKAVGGLAAASVTPVWTAPQETDANVVAWLGPRVLPDEAVAVQLHGGHAPSYDTLATEGHEVLSVMPYRTGPPDDLTAAEGLVASILTGEVDVVTFTSPGAVRTLIDIAEAMGEEHAGHLRTLAATTMAIAAVGPVTAGACEDAGLRVRLQPSRSRSMDLVREVERFITLARDR